MIVYDILIYPALTAAAKVIYFFQSKNPDIIADPMIPILVCSERFYLSHRWFKGKPAANARTGIRFIPEFMLDSLVDTAVQSGLKVF